MNDRLLDQKLRRKIDGKTKPYGALGQLEQLAMQIGQIQQTTSPTLQRPHIVVFAADHGIAMHGVSAYPQEVTYQMVLNFLTGGAAINVFCRQNDMALTVVDAGVIGQFSDNADIVHAKIGKGTNSFLSGAAMSSRQCHDAIQRGQDIVVDIYSQGCNVIGFGEMGIGNTSSASILMSVLCDFSLERCVGRGTGLDDDQWKRKIMILKQAKEKGCQQIDSGNVIDVMIYFGGFEVVMMVGAMLQAARQRMIILVDGFIASTAFLAASLLNDDVKQCAVFCHESNEHGHHDLLRWLKVQPLLKMNMRLGEGTGAALAYPLVKAAVNFLNEMACFKDAGVSEKST